MCIDWDDLEPEDYEQPEPQEVDEDYCQLQCPKCEKTVYFGEFMSSKNMCVVCWDKEVQRLRADAEDKVAEFEKVFYAKHPELL